MIEFKKIILKNFMSWGNKLTEIPLDNQGVTVIVGENQDSGIEGHSRNGAGKSTIYEALSWCVFGDTIDNIKVGNIANKRNKKNMVVELYFSVDGTDYKIRRTKKPDELSLFREDANITSNTVQNDILNLVGLSQELFLNSSMLVHLDSFTPFMAKKPSEQRDFIEQIIAMDLLKDRASVLKDINKDNVAEMAAEEATIRNTEAQNKRYIERLDEISTKASTWDDDRSKEIEEMQTEISSIEEIDTVELREIIRAVEEAKTKVSDTEDLLKEVIKVKSSLDSSFDEVRERVESLEASTCPYCHQKYINEQKLNEEREELHGISEDLEVLKHEHKNISSELEKLNEEYVSVANRADPDFKTERDVDILDNELKRLRDNMNKLINDKDNPFVEEMQYIQSQIVDIDTSSVDQRKVVDSHIKFLTKLLTDNKSFIRKTIIDKFIGYLNERINHRLSAIGLPHTVIINNDLSLDIDYFGESVSYGNLSNGEKLRLNIATNLAFRDILKLNNVSFNSVFVDEVLDAGGDTSLFMTVFNMLQSEGVNLFLITHNTEIISESDILFKVVRKENFSNLSIEKT